MNILIVDDEPKIRKGLKTLISRIYGDKVNINTAQDGNAGVEMFCEHKPDLVLVDMKMPNMDGMELIDKIKKLKPDVIIVIISGYAQFEYAQKAVQYGVMDYILKPVNPQRVQQIVDKAQNLLSERKEIDNKYKYIVSNIEELKEKFVFDLIFETKYYGEKEIRLKYEELGLENKDYCIGILGLLDDNVHDFSWKAKSNSVIQSKIENVINSLEGGMVFSNSPGLYIMLIFVNGEREKYLEKLRYAILNSTGTECEIQFGEIYSDPISMPSSYKQSLYKIKNKRNLLSDIHNKNENKRHDEKKLDYDKISVIVHKAIKYIEDNYNKNIKLTDIAQSVFVHPSYLSELFKKEVGQNISDYITNYRILKAKELLCVFENKVYMVAGKVGFESPRYFGQVFKKNVGITPVEYREKYFLINK